MTAKKLFSIDVTIQSTSVNAINLINLLYNSLTINV